MSKLIVTAVGPATSVQDGGRYGAQRYGLTPSGAADHLALAAANCLVGNPPLPLQLKSARSARPSRRAKARCASRSRALRGTPKSRAAGVVQ